MVRYENKENTAQHLLQYGVKPTWYDTKGTWLGMFDAFYGGYVKIAFCFVFVQHVQCVL